MINKNDWLIQKFFSSKYVFICGWLLPSWFFYLFKQISNLKKILKGILDYNHEVRAFFSFSLEVLL